jgi:two-component system, cell cycle response regulator DivK
MAKILLAEDDEMSSDIIRTRLARNGHEVTAVSNGGECVTKAREEAFDIYILDLSMPVKDGVQTLKELKGHPASAGKPAMALSAHSMDRDRQKAIEAGFDEFDTKPINLPRLLEKIGKLLAKE